MVQASINWASILGIVLFLCWIPWIAYAINGLNKFSSKSNSIQQGLFYTWSLSAPLISSFILFFQGWRLAPILQFLQFLLVSGLILQSLEIYNIDRKQKSRKVNLLEDLEPLEPLGQEKATETKTEVTSIEVELKKLNDLRDKELITDDELQKLRQKTLNI